MSKAAQYADSDEVTIQQAKRTIATIVGNSKGKDESVSSKELAQRVGLKPTTVRDLIPEIRREYNLPVASSNQGYYRIVDHGEFVEIMERIEDTVATKKQHQSELAKAYHGERKW